MIIVIIITQSCKKGKIKDILIITCSLYVKWSEQLFFKYFLYFGLEIRSTVMSLPTSQKNPEHIIRL